MTKTMHQKDLLPGRTSSTNLKLIELTRLLELQTCKISYWSKDMQLELTSLTLVS